MTRHSNPLTAQLDHGGGVLLGLGVNIPLGVPRAPPPLLGHTKGQFNLQATSRL